VGDNRYADERLHLRIQTILFSLALLSTQPALTKLRGLISSNCQPDRRHISPNLGETTREHGSDHSDTGAKANQ